MVTVEVIESKKSEGQTSKQTYNQTNKQTRGPLSKGESRPGQMHGGRGQDMSALLSFYCKSMLHNDTFKYCNSTKVLK